MAQLSSPAPFAPCRGAGGTAVSTWRCCTPTSPSPGAGRTQMRSAVPAPPSPGPQQLPEPLASALRVGKRERGAQTTQGKQPVARITPASPSLKCSHPWGGIQQPPAFLHNSHCLLRGGFSSFLPFFPTP